MRRRATRPGNLWLRRDREPHSEQSAFFEEYVMEGLSEASIDQGLVRDRVGSTLKRLSRTGALPTLPAVASTALGIARDPEADVDQLCRIIQTDVGLSARVLRIANSAAIGRRTPARKLSEAVVTVGMRKTCDVLVAACARQLYDTTSPRAEVLWNHALAAAVATEELARRTRRVDPGRAFLPGLFHDVGRIAFLLADEVALEVVDRLVDAGEGDRTVLEQEWYGFDHTEAAAILAEDWGLALEQCDAIRWHHDPENAGAAYELARLINAADYLAYAIGCGSTERAPEDVTVSSIGLDSESEAALVDRVRELFVEQKQLLG
jgi:HD-like signal output (HDOD) protein